MTTLYKVGDYARITKSDDGYNETLGDQTGMVGTVVQGNELGDAYLTFPHTGDQQFYYHPTELAPATPEIEYEFKAGDWAKITSESYGGYSGEVFEVKTASKGRVSLRLFDPITNREWEGYFLNSAIELADKPKPEPKFKAGDWVVVHGRGDKWDGTVARVHSGPNNRTCYTLALLEPAEDDYLYLREDKLKAAEEPHWALTKNVGDAAQVVYGSGEPSRIVIKTAVGEWTHLYQTVNGTVDVKAVYSNVHTARLMSGRVKVCWIR